MAIATVGHPKLWVATPKARSLLCCNYAIKKEQSLGLGGDCRALPHSSQACWPRACHRKMPGSE